MGLEGCNLSKTRTAILSKRLTITISIKYPPF
jgi:hypothetical protein